MNRKKGESFAAFKKRRTEENREMRAHLRGTPVVVTGSNRDAARAALKTLSGKQRFCDHMFIGSNQCEKCGVDVSVLQTIHYRGILWRTNERQDKDGSAA